MSLLIASIAGAALFFLLDSLHVHVGIWEATRAHGVPPAFFFVYALGIAAAYAVIGRFERRYRLRVDRRTLAADVAYFTVVLAAHLLVFKQEAALAVICGALLAARLIWFRAPGDVTIALTVMGLDLCAELLLWNAGTFRYRYAAHGPLPLWLLPMWGALGLSIRRFFAGVHSVASAGTRSAPPRPSPTP